MLCVFGNEECKALVDATLLEEFLKFLLDLKVESFELIKQCDLRYAHFTKQQKGLTHLRADIESTAFPISLRGEVRRQFSIVVIRHVFNDEHTLLANSVDTQCAGDRRLIKITRQRRSNRSRKCVYALTLMTVSEQRSGYDGSPASSFAFSSSSGAPKFSSSFWRSAMEKIKRILFFFLHC